MRRRLKGGACLWLAAVRRSDGLGKLPGAADRCARNYCPGKLPIHVDMLASTPRVPLENFHIFASNLRVM